MPTEARFLERLRQAYDIYRAAEDGWEEAVYSKGEVVGFVRRFDNRLAIQLLRARRPEVFARRVEVDQKVRDERAEKVTLTRLEDPAVLDAVVAALEPDDE